MEAYSKSNTSPSKRKVNSPTKPATKRSRPPLFAVSKGNYYEVTSSKVVDSYDYVLQPSDIHNRIQSKYTFNLDLFYKIINLVKNARSSLTSQIKNATTRLRALDDLVENKTDEFHEYLHNCAAIYAKTYVSNSSANPKQHMIHEQEYLVHCLNTKIACLITSVDNYGNPKSSNQFDANDSAISSSSSNTDTETNVTNTSVELVDDFQCLMYESFPFACDTLNPNIVEFNGAKSKKSTIRKNKLNDLAKLGISPVTSSENILSDNESNSTASSASLPDAADFFPFLDWSESTI